MLQPRHGEASGGGSRLSNQANGIWKMYRYFFYSHEISIFISHCNGIASFSLSGATDTFHIHVWGAFFIGPSRASAVYVSLGRLTIKAFQSHIDCESSMDLFIFFMNHVTRSLIS